MSFWGKLIGGTAGFAIAGPLGALLGLAAGHGVDKASNSNPKDNVQNFASYSNLEKKEQIFATGVIALSAKLAKIDGKVSGEEIVAFKKIFEFSKTEQKQVANLYNLAKKDVCDYENYAKQIFDEFRDEKSILLEILNALFAIAYSDKVLHPKEEDMLKKIAIIFMLKNSEYESIKSLFNNQKNNISEKLESYYKILGVNPNEDLDKINQNYKKLVRDYHPDKLQGLGLPKDFINLANKKLATLNEAYDEIKKQRNNS